MSDYNTDRDHLILKEYGRNVQNLVEYITKIEDKDKRTASVHTLIKTLKQLNPSVRDSAENTQRIWDHIYVMSGKKLDVDSPFPTPTDEVRYQRPQKVKYAQHKLKYRHYGNNIELLVKQVVATEDPETRMRGLGKVGRIMKSFYGIWNKDKIEDEMILEHMRKISGAEINVDIETIKAMNMFDVSDTPQRDFNSNGSSTTTTTNNSRQSGRHQQRRHGSSNNSSSNRSNYRNNKRRK